MNLIRKIVGFCMECWIEWRAGYLLTALEVALSREDPLEIERFWQKLPQQLRGKAQRMMKEFLWKSANSGDFSYDMIQSARDCGAEISDEEVRQLLKTAFEHENFSCPKLELAKKLYGKPLPKEGISALAEKYQGNGDIWFLMEEIEEEEEQEQEQLVAALLETFAQRGKYNCLKEAYYFLKQDIPINMLRTCFDALRQQDMPNAEALIKMCIDLRDWSAANELIYGWKDEKATRRLAAELALTAFEALNKPAKAEV